MRDWGNVLLALIVAWLATIGLLRAQETAPNQPLAKTVPKNQTTDDLVPHISTAPANAGKRVELFVRENVESRRRGKVPVVLMIGGATVSAVPDFDLEMKTIAG